MWLVGKRLLNSRALPSGGVLSPVGGAVAAVGDERGGAGAVGAALAELPGVLEAVAPAGGGLVGAAEAERGDARRLRVVQRALAHRAQAVAQIESVELGAARGIFLSAGEVAAVEVLVAGRVRQASAPDIHQARPKEIAGPGAGTGAQPRGVERAPDVVPAEVAPQPLFAVEELLAAGAQLPVRAAAGLPVEVSLVEIGAQIVDDLVALGAEEPDVLPFDVGAQVRVNAEEQMKPQALAEESVEVVGGLLVGVVAELESPAHLEPGLDALGLRLFLLRCGCGPRRVLLLLFAARASGQLARHRKQGENR